MSDQAAHLVDRVLPIVPVRQWVLSLPYPLRLGVAYDPALCTAVLGVATRALVGQLEVRAQGALGVVTGRAGAVTAIWRLGSALNLNVHFHTLAPDGVFTCSDAQPGRVEFHRLAPPRDAQVRDLVGLIAHRVKRLLERRDLLDRDVPSEPSLLSELGVASLRLRIATGPRAGRGVRRLGDRVLPDASGLLTGPRCAAVAGFSLHANVAVEARDRSRLERLARYICRPPIASESE